jgi:putative peptidoglycan lipid II flippase
MVVGFATILSRVLGFVRDMLVARALGAGPVADAFLVAFRLPNMFRRILSEGGLNAAFVPIYLRLRGEGGQKAALGFAGEAAGNLAVVLMLLVAVSEIIAPWLVLGLAGGFRDAPVTFELAQKYTRIALPFVAFTTLASLVAAVLNAERRFLVAALAPASLNVVLIGSLMWSEWQGAPLFRTASSLAWSVSFAGFVHLCLVLAALWAGPLGWFRLRLGLSPAMRRLVVLGLPALLASATSQLVLLVATQIASVQPGAVSWLYYADRVFQMPLGFVAVAMGIVLLPEIAAREAANDPSGRRETVDRALVLGLALGLPAAVALALLAEPIVSVLFERGKFTGIDRERTAAAMAAFAWGLPPAVVAKVMAQIYFARETPRYPLVAGLCSIAVAVLSGLWLSAGQPARGAALAATAAFWTQAALLLAMALHHRLWWPGPGFGGRLGRVGLAALVMGVALVAMGGLARPVMTGSAGLTGFLVLGAVCAAGLGLYGAVALALGLARPADLARMLRRPAA